MRRLTIGAMLLGFLAGPVYAQDNPDKMSDDPIVLDQLQKKKDADAIDRQYSRALDKTRKANTDPKVDPWSNMRGADDSKTKK
jgi:hypothetical protein